MTSASLRSTALKAVAARDQPFADAAVRAVFDAYPMATRRSLLRLRAMILETARELPQTGPIIETLKWNQPAYLPSGPRIGTTIRIDALQTKPHGYAIFFHCQTSIVASIRELYPAMFTFKGNRALHFSNTDAIPRDALKHCIAMALTYHLKSTHAKDRP